MTTRHGTSTAAHYGSAAAELGVCVRAVGLADRSDLGKLRISGSAAGIATLMRDVAGAPIEPSGVATAAAAWWCAASPERVIVLCEAERLSRLLGVLRARARRLPGVEVEDISASLSAVALVGHRVPQVLSALEALGPGGHPRTAAPFAAATIAGADVHVLLQSDRRAIVLVEPEHADRVWHAVAAAGRPHGLSCVGADAVERFALVDRPSIPSTPSR